MKLGGISGAGSSKANGKEKGMKYQGTGKGAEKGDIQRDVSMEDTVMKEDMGKVFNGGREKTSGELKVSTLQVIWGADPKNEGVDNHTGGVSGNTEELVKEDKKRDDLFPVLKKEVETWENEIKRIEEALTRVRSKDRKESLEIQMANAQVMLKQALIQLGKANELQRDEKSRDVIMVENEEGKIVSEGDRVSGRKKDKEVTKGSDKNGSTFLGYVQATEHAPVRNFDDNTDIKMVEQSNKNGKTKNKNKQDLNWAEMSDDDTVTLENLQDKDDASGNWRIVEEKNKRHKLKTSDGNTDNKEKGMEALEKPASILNPYGNKKYGNILATKQASTEKSTLTSYMEKVKGRQRTPNKNEIRVTTAFTPRTTGTGDYRRVAQEILKYAKEFDEEIILLPWDGNTKLGPIGLDDLANPNAMHDVIKAYFDKPPYANWMLGVPIYGIGIRFSTNMDKFEFINNWNIQKRQYKEMKKVALTINLAPTQKSNKAFIIGIAVGSTENQDYEVLNKKLQEETGIKGIEVSFQNVNQFGISQDFWKIANSKANKVNRDKMSREHLRTKYLWAPNALAVYVPTKEAANKARKIMIQKYGKLVNGADPVWADGSSMRFLPIKGSAIKNEKTKEIVRKRMAFHIWMKANEVSFETNMVNINEETHMFDGLTFHEKVLNMKDSEGNRVFSHFNRDWCNDPHQKKWSISVKPHLASAAQKVLNNIQNELQEQYGDQVNYFFHNNNDSTEWADIVNKRVSGQEDEDDWFDDDDDVDDMIKKGVIDCSFLQFLSERGDDDKQSVVSWGTGDTTYTEMMANKETSGTSTSSITLDTSTLSTEETTRRKSLVKQRLFEKNLADHEIEDILNNKDPFQLAFSGVHLPTWDVDKEVFLIMAIRGQHSQYNNNQDEQR